MLDARSENRGIAIVGIGCRLPGGADSPASFWELLRSGADGITEVPRERWDAERFYDPDPHAPGKLYVRAGGFLREPIDAFDAQFFGISPREAAYLDPQQRLLLEVTWEALEDAGLPPGGLAGSDTGVYVGGFMSDGLLTQLSPLNREQIGPHSAVGSTLTILSNRISYFLDLRGPSLTIDTACSSSLVALHQACQALLQGECELALAGGVNVIQRPEPVIAMCKGGFLAADGRCKSFDARADGYGRGEGAAVVVLRPLAAALAAGERIYAVVRASGVNQDGRTDGITVPSGAAQEALIRRVLAQAQLEPSQLSYIEAHGTGTALGDPTEVGALGRALGRGQGPQQPCWIGSVKPNIGHLEAASGIAGAIKAALCLRQRAVPPVANLQQLHPAIPFAELGLRVPRQLEPLGGEGPLRAAVNSFGYGGTNAHVILEEAPAPRAALRGAQPPLRSLVLSARSGAALRELAQAYAARLADPGLDVDALCSAAALGRAPLEQRLGLAGGSREALCSQLQVYLAEGRGAGIATGSGPAAGERPVFVFSGMGPQWWAMGRELLEHEPVFRRCAERIAEHFDALAGGSLLKELGAEQAASRIRETQIAQPANFLIQVALCELLRSWGVEPAAVVGHSVGEVASAHVAGVLDLPSAVRVAYERSRIQKRAAGLGGMLATALGEDEAEALAYASGGEVSLAAVNGPRSSTLAGASHALQRIAAELERRGVFARALQVELAYHSPYMDALRPALLAALAGLPLLEPALPLYSTVSGERFAAGDYGAAYWCRNIREPVRFAHAIGALLRDGHRLFLEVGPHPVLGVSIQQCLAERGETGVVLATLRRERPEREALREALAGLYASGARIEWSRPFAPSWGAVELPRYPWQRQRLSHEGEAARADRVAAAAHPLLGRRLDAPEPLWQADLSLGRLPYLADHSVEELVVLPGAAYVELALAAARELGGGAPAALQALEFSQALVLERGQAPLVQLGYRPDSGEFRVHGRSHGGAPWQMHARGRIGAPAPAAGKPLELGALRERCSEPLCATEHYAQMAARGLRYGPSFQGVRSLWRSPHGEVLAWIELPAALAATGHSLHPALLDACFQALLSGTRDGELYVPVSIAELRLYANPGRAVWCHGGALRRDAREIEGELRLYGEDAALLVELRGVRARALRAAQRPAADLERCLYTFAWQPAPAAQAAAAPAAHGPWLVFEDVQGAAQQLCAQLEARGAACALRVRRAQAPRAEGGTAERSRPLGPGARELDPADRAALAELLNEALELGVRGIAYLWPLEGALAQDPAAVDALVPLLHLVQELAGRAGAALPRLCVVTRGLDWPEPGAAAPLALEQSALLGLLRVVFNEHPELRARVLDIDGDPHTLERLADELLAGSAEEEVLLRGAQRHVHRLRRAVLPAAAPAADASPRFDPGASYLVTGGLGGFGLQLAHWLLAQGARQLVLVGRRGAATPGAAEALAAFARAGARVLPLAADVGSEDDVLRVLRECASRMPALRGVFHCAAVLDDGPLGQLERGHFERVFAPKARGAWLLHRHTRSLALEHFVLFSSIASLIGSPGQASYVAANAFLDALARERRRSGLPGTSIQWGALAQVGMAARHAEVEEYFRRVGVGSFSPAEALQLCDALLRGAPAEIGAARMDWRLWGQFNPAWAASPRYRELLAESDARAAGSCGSSARAPRGARAPQARRAPRGAPRGELVAQTLRLQRAAVDPGASLLQLGVDSLLAMELQTAIDARLGLQVSTLELLKGQSIEQLAQRLAERLEAAPAAAAAGAKAAAQTQEKPAALPLEDAAELLVRLDELSPEQLDRVAEQLASSREEIAR